MPIERLFKQTGMRQVASRKRAQFSSPEVEGAANDAQALMEENGWDLDSVIDQMYTAYNLTSSEVDEVEKFLTGSAS